MSIVRWKDGEASIVLGQMDRGVLSAGDRCRASLLSAALTYGVEEKNKREHVRDMA